jgi:hypothetical protein
LSDGRRGGLEPVVGRGRVRFAREINDQVRLAEAPAQFDRQ